MSNIKAFIFDILENITKEVKDNDAKIQVLTQENYQLQVEIQRLKEDINMCKGKFTTLNRDAGLSKTYLCKVIKTHFQNYENSNYFNSRVRVVESDLEGALSEKIDANFEVQRLQSQLNTLEKQNSETMLQ